MKKKAVILHSGGLDSTTLLAIALAENYACYPLLFDYGQRHHVELSAAQRVLDFYKIQTGKTVNIPLNLWGASSLTDLSMSVKKNALSEDEIPSSYVPARNLIFLSFAVAYAEAIGASDIFIGVNSVDYSGYPDCRRAFIDSFAQTAKLATRAADFPEAKYLIHTPLQTLSKAQIIQRATQLGAPLHLTHSCYAPDSFGRACGECDSCLLRKTGFMSANVNDPTLYTTH